LNSIGTDVIALNDDLQAQQTLTQGFTQQISTQNTRLDLVDARIQDIGGKVQGNVSTIQNMNRALDDIFRRLYSDDRLKIMKSSSKMLLQHCLN